MFWDLLEGGKVRAQLVPRTVQERRLSEVKNTRGMWTQTSSFWHQAGRDAKRAWRGQRLGMVRKGSY